MDRLDFVVSGLAMNGGKARVCIQRRDLAAYGFGIGEPIDVVFNDSAVVVIARPEGERKVARVTDKRRGFDYATLDIRFSDDQRQKMFNGAAKLAVSVEFGYMVIKAL